MDPSLFVIFISSQDCKTYSNDFIMYSSKKDFIKGILYIFLCILIGIVIGVTVPVGLIYLIEFFIH